MFNINVPKADSDKGTVRLLRYGGGEKRDWEAFEARLDSCYAETCRYVVDPPMGGYFAVVVEKEGERSSSWIWVLIAVIAAAVAAAAYYFTKVRRRKR